MKKTLLTGAVAALISFGLVGGVKAADAPIVTAPTMQDAVAPLPPLWTGPYLGLSGGYSFGNDNGWMLGAFGGYNWQAVDSNFVLGAEADIYWADIDPNIDMLGSLRGRAGMAMGRALIYGTGGLAYSDEDLGWALGGGVEAKFTDNMFGRAEYVYHDVGSDNVHAVRVGLGFSFNTGY